MTDLDRVREQIADLDDWIDGASIGRVPPLAMSWARIAKITEEHGEAVEAMIAWTGQNPRKSRPAACGDVIVELADTALTAILAMQHFLKDADETTDALWRRLDYLHTRMLGHIAEQESA